MISGEIVPNFCVQKFAKLLTFVVNLRQNVLQMFYKTRLWQFLRR